MPIVNNPINSECLYDDDDDDDDVIYSDHVTKSCPISRSKT